jgi:hypothetical protein
MKWLEMNSFVMLQRSEFSSFWAYRSRSLKEIAGNMT